LAPESTAARGWFTRYPEGIHRPNHVRIADPLDGFSFNSFDGLAGNAALLAHPAACLARWMAAPGLRVSLTRSALHLA
jgi:hypothetical protein